MGSRHLELLMWYSVRVSRLTLGSFSNDDGNGKENVTWK